jgi:hypothetical protein
LCAKTSYKAASAGENLRPKASGDNDTPCRKRGTNSAEARTVEASLRLGYAFGSFRADVNVRLGVARRIDPANSDYLELGSAKYVLLKMRSPVKSELFYQSYYNL